AVIEAGRNEMRADQPVGREAADEEAGAEQPEIAVGDVLAERLEGDGDGIAELRWRPRQHAGLAIGLQPDILRMLAHQKRDERDQRGHGGDSTGDGEAPAVTLDEGGEEREED